MNITNLTNLTNETLTVNLTEECHKLVSCECPALSPAYVNILFFSAMILLILYIWNRFPEKPLVAGGISGMITLILCAIGSHLNWIPVWLFASLMVIIVVVSLYMWRNQLE
jgi:hypothetical protein